MNGKVDLSSEKERPPPQEQPHAVTNAPLQQQSPPPGYPVPSYQQPPQLAVTTSNMNGEVYPQPSYTIYRGPLVAAKKSLVEAYLLCLILGLLGAHHFYLRRPGFGCLYLFTFGLLGCGYVYDLFRMPCLVRDANRRMQDPKNEDVKRLDDAYGLWFPFGLVGLHHFYLRQPAQGVFYMCTFGLLGIGWIVDAFRMPSMVEAYNKKTHEEKQNKSVCTAVAFGISPFGILGVHHFYLERMYFGLLYLFSFGFLGVGWIVDWFRIPILTKRANQHRKGIDLDRKYLDDAYVLAFPLGFTGLHHFYLGRHGWGLLYLFTFGFLGIGWLVDLVRLPCLVEEYNKTHAERRSLPFVRCSHNGGVTLQSSNNQGCPNVIMTSGIGNPGYIISQSNPPPYYPSQYGAVVYPPQLPSVYPSVHGVVPNQHMAPPPPAYTENIPETAPPLPSKQ